MLAPTGQSQQTCPTGPDVGTLPVHEQPTPPPAPWTSGYVLPQSNVVDPKDCRSSSVWPFHSACFTARVLGGLSWDGFAVQCAADKKPSAPMLTPPACDRYLLGRPVCRSGCRTSTCHRMLGTGENPWARGSQRRRPNKIFASLRTGGRGGGAGRRARFLSEDQGQVSCASWRC